MDHKLPFDRWRFARQYQTQAELAELAGVENSDISVHGGIAYPGGCWIEILTDGEYSVLIGNTQFVNAELLKAERHLYDNWYEGNDEAEASAREINLDRITDTLFAAAAAMEGFHEALKTLQDLSGMGSNSHAEVWFEGDAEDKWASQTPTEREALLRDWIDFERPLHGEGA